MTPRNYKELVQLHDDLYARGLRILAFPCNQFGKQEPGNAQEIRAFADGYGTQFDMFAKVDVNGPNAHPVFQFLKSHLSDVLGSSIKWNWTKFLVDRDGKPKRRFSPPANPLSLRPAIEALLDQPASPIQATISTPSAEVERL